MPRLAALALALSATSLLPACSSHSSPEEACPSSYEKQKVSELAASWYLYAPELLASVNPADYADSTSLLRALVAPAVSAGKDRGWSFVTTIAQNQQYYGEGAGVGFGIGTLVRNSTHLFISQVYAGSAADLAGFVRGDEILEVGDSEATLVPVSGLITAGKLTQALGLAEAGVTRTFRVAPRADPANPVLRTMTKSLFSLSPVAYAGTIPAGTAGLPRDVGVVVLRTFVSTADAALRSAFAGFRASGVTDVVVDFRYNGGGLLSTAELLTNLLGGAHAGQPMYDLLYNPTHASGDRHALFVSQPESIPATRVAFITTRASASASELVPNALEPYLAPAGAPPAIALVGATTYGKPVGQTGIYLTPCPKILYLVSFGLRNAETEGGYFSGLPDAAFGGPLCGAADDLTHDLGTVGETSTDAALYWLANGTCPPVAAAAMGALTVMAPDEYPTPAQPTIAQLESPGLF
jgi:C-terminal processing protease CtpA/Prc